MLKKLISVTALILLAMTLFACGSKSNTALSDALDPDTTYYAVITVKDYGTVTVKLDQSAAPQTCANFVSLAQEGFYNGLTFHRIIEGFMAQGGAGDCDTTVFGEFSANGFQNPLSHTRGAISMARLSFDNDSASSQFFIVHEDCPSLDGQYAVFGYVTEGMEVIDAICKDARPTDNNGSIEKAAQPVITDLTIRTE